MNVHVKTTSQVRNDVGLSLSPETSQEMLQLLVDNIKEYAILMLDPAGHVTTWTPTAERLKGYRAEEIIGKHFSVFLCGWWKV